MTPVDFVARIAALIPPPRQPPLRYFGVFGPHSSWRKLRAPAVNDSKQTEPSSSAAQAPASAPTASVLDEVKGSANRQPPAGGAGAALVEGSSQHSAPSGRDASPKQAAGNALNPWRIDWATLLKRTYDFDALSCPCGGRFRVAELVTEAERAKELLEQFEMSTKPPPIVRARSPDWG